MICSLIFGNLLKTTIMKRTPDEEESIKRGLKWAAEYLLTNVDLVFTTCITATSKWLREFKDKVSVVFLDETGSITEADADIVWQSDIPLVAAWDPA
jgi:hypothetical protein